MVFHSIRWRILAWNFGLLAATASVLLVAFYRHEKQARLQELDLRLRQEMTRGMGAMNEVVPGVAGPRNPAPAPRANGKAAARGENSPRPRCPCLRPHKIRVRLSTRPCAAARRPRRGLWRGRQGIQLVTAANKRQRSPRFVWWTHTCKRGRWSARSTLAGLVPGR